MDLMTVIDNPLRWTTIYNANLDCAPAQRRTLPALRDELKKWEDDSRRHASAKEKNIDPLGGIPKEKEGGRAYDEYQVRRHSHGTVQGQTLIRPAEKTRHAIQGADGGGKTTKTRARPRGSSARVIAPELGHQRYGCSRRCCMLTPECNIKIYFHYWAERVPVSPPPNDIPYIL